MGKAFTDEEREATMEKLRREGLKLLAQDGIRNVSIRELTRRAGIAQGGFYSFYKDKDAFVTDLILLRIREKTDLMLEHKETTLADPVGFLADLLYREGMHLKENMVFNNRVSGSIEFFVKSDKHDEGLGKKIYKDFINKLIEYWEANGYQVTCDVDAIISAAVMGGIMFSNAELIPEKHFGKIYREYCNAQIHQFMQVSKTK